MSLRFGTDGVRGVANVELTPEYALAFGRAAAAVLGAPTFVVGRDTRVSGPMLEAALCAGLAAEGVTVRRLGVCPTPAVAWVAAREHVAGVMISASHNPFADNGIKLFAPGGLKLSDADQDRFEPVLAERLAGRGNGRRAGADVGRVLDDPGAVGSWCDGVVASIEGRDLAGMELVVDCANGAAAALAPPLLRRLGADVSVLGAEPDGLNINDGCGSTELGPLREAVLARGADVGLAFDGDADRVLAVDAAGRVIDGDQLIAMCAIDRHRRGVLRGDTVVVTVMANLGFRLGMARHGIDVVETPVGDRYVLEALESGGWALGGEQSGHVIFRDIATTGDGLLTAVQLLDLLRRSGEPLGALADAAMTRLPQVLHNVVVARRAGDVAEAIAVDVERVAARLGTSGRVLVRPSGTEPLLRVMVEAPDEAVAAEAAAELVAAAERATAS